MTFKHLNKFSIVIGYLVLCLVQLTREKKHPLEKIPEGAKILSRRLEDTYGSVILSFEQGSSDANRIVNLIMIEVESSSADDQFYLSDFSFYLLNNEAFVSEIELTDEKLTHDPVTIVSLIGSTQVSYKLGKSGNQIKIVFKKKPTSLRGFFSDSSATKIEFKDLKTEDVTDMYDIFARCYHLTSVDLSSLDTSNVKDMQFMFYLDKSLKNVNLLLTNTLNVTTNDEFFENVDELDNCSYYKYEDRKSVV